MSKKTIIISIVITMLLLSSCSLIGAGLIQSYEKDNQISQKSTEQIVDAIKKQDESSLKELFSKKSIAEVNDFDDDINRLFDFIQGEIVSYDIEIGPSMNADIDIEDGYKCKYLDSTFQVNTSEQVYFIAFREYVVDTADPDNIGICSLYIIDKNDTADNITYWGDGKWTYGINIIQDNIVKPDSKLIC